MGKVEPNGPSNTWSLRLGRPLAYCVHSRPSFLGMYRMAVTTALYSRPEILLREQCTISRLARIP